MSLPSPERWRAAAAIIGGLLWIGAGSALALRPARVPGEAFRRSTDVLPWLGLGLVLIAVAAVGLHAGHAASASPAGRRAGQALLVGALLYAMGHATRPFLGGAWEPAVPLGLLTAVVALGVLGAVTWRARVLPAWVGALVSGSAVTLLLFNDQYVTAWASAPLRARLDRDRERVPPARGSNPRITVVRPIIVPRRSTAVRLSGAAGTGSARKHREYPCRCQKAARPRSMEQPGPGTWALRRRRWRRGE